MARKSKPLKDKEVRREERLRPSRFQGYNRDGMGLYLLERHAYEIAETQFRRAAFLNPLEPRFKAHLAWCLYRQAKHGEAIGSIRETLKQKPDDAEFMKIRTLVAKALREQTKS